MEKSKWCCRIFPVVLTLLSAVIALGIWYFDADSRSFAFLGDKDEIFNFAGTVLFIALVPIGIFYYLNDKEKYQSRARQISLLGFIPAIVVLILTIL